MGDKFCSDLVNLPPFNLSIALIYIFTLLLLILLYSLTSLLIFSPSSSSSRHHLCSPILPSMCLFPAPLLCLLRLSTNSLPLYPSSYHRTVIILLVFSSFFIPLFLTLSSQNHHHFLHPPIVYVSEMSDNKQMCDTGIYHGQSRSYQLNIKHVRATGCSDIYICTRRRDAKSILSRGVSILKLILNDTFMFYAK